MFDCMDIHVYIFFIHVIEKKVSSGVAYNLKFSGTHFLIRQTNKQRNKQTNKLNHFRSFFILRYENIQNIYESKVNDYRVLQYITCS